MKLLWFVTHLLEYLGGCREDPPAGLPLLESHWARGLWGAPLAGAIILFRCHNSRFLSMHF